MQASLNPSAFPQGPCSDVRLSAEFRNSKYFIFPILARQQGLVHAVFSRHGGISSPPYDSLNTGYNTGDSNENVNYNLGIVKQTMEADHLVSMKQVHGINISIIREENLPESKVVNDTDGLITNIPGILLMVKQADCQAVILFDPVKKVIANIHCGWRGNTLNILATAVNRMRSAFECDPSNLVAAIGPSLGPCCAEFRTYKKIFPECFEKFKDQGDNFDLWGISRMQLTEAGIRKDNIEIAGICTKCNNDLFFSYRAGKVTGRFATVVMLS